MARTGKAKAKALTAKQKQVLDLLGEKKGPSEIAEIMGITPNGVQMHIRRIRLNGHSVPRSNGRRRAARTQTASSNGRSENGLPTAKEAIDAVNNVLETQVDQYDKQIEEAALTAKQASEAAEKADDELRRLNEERNALEQHRAAMVEG